jgi:hypothetical protein
MSISEFAHSNLPPDQRHAPHSFEFADETAREAATGLLGEDVGKFALQLDDSSVWILLDDDPVTWSPIGGPDVAHAALTVVDGTGINLTLTVQELTAEPIFAGTGAAGTVARSDHDHDADYPAIADVPVVLSDLDDVDEAVPADGDVLTWLDTPGEWAPQPSAGGTTPAFVDLTDVAIVSPLAGDVPTWDEDLDKWVNQPLSGVSVNSVNGQTGDVDLDADDIDDTSTTNKFTDASDIAKLAAIEASADVTDAGNVGTAIDGATAKTTPVDADTMPLIDSAASNVLKKVTWANIKATLKSYFDTLYATISHTHTVTVGMTFILGDGTNVITSAEPPQIVRLPVAHTVVRWDMEGDASGTITLEVDRAASGTPTSFSSIAGSEKPALAGPAQTASDATPFASGDTTLDAADRLKISVSGTPTVVKRLYFHIELTRAI